MTLLAHERWQRHDGWVRRAAWSDKTLPISVEPGGRDRLFACLCQVAKRFESRSVVLSVSQTRVATPPNHDQWPKSRSRPVQLLDALGRCFLECEIAAFSMLLHRST